MLPLYYDPHGNPLSDGTWTYTWEHGRELTRMTSSDSTITYDYNADGLRIKKTVDGVVHNYVYSGGKLVEETYGDTKLNFSYDANGNPYTFSYTKGDKDPSVYHYVLNLQGDVVRIVTNKGVTRVTYEYDAWGNITKMESTNETLANANPLRYRGYYYDRETGLYYLQSRYYNPQWGRFINADAYASTGQGLLGNNMFAYCGNNPVNRVDPTGQFWNGIWNFLETAFAEAGSAMAAMSPAYAGCGGVAAADGLLPIGDAVAVVGVALLTVGAIGYGISQAALSPSISLPEVEEKVEVITTTPSEPTVIYRYGGTNPGNLTPRLKDLFTGLSFSTVPMPGAAMTTIEALNATGEVWAVQDSATHVSVRPIGGTIQDWIVAGPSSRWTKAVQSVVVKWNGGY